MQPEGLAGNLLCTPHHVFLMDVCNYQMHEVKTTLRHNENKKEYINVLIMISFTCKHTKS
jgi:hypothetical protein